MLSTPEVEVLYSRAGQTADDMIERATHRFSAYGEILAVTDDFAERDTVISLGGMASSCSSFIQTIEEMRWRSWRTTSSTTTARNETDFNAGDDR